MYRPNSFCTSVPFLQSVSEKSSLCCTVCHCICLQGLIAFLKEVLCSGARPGLHSQRPLGFCRRLDSCKLTSEPVFVLFSLTFNTLCLSPFHLHLHCIWVAMCFPPPNNLCSLTPLAFSSKCIPLCLRWLCFQWGFYWDQTCIQSWPVPWGMKLGEERPFSHDLQACDHSICRHECWGIHMRIPGDAHKKHTNGLLARLKLSMRGREICGWLNKQLIINSSQGILEIFR